jgi:hypothetical protein
MRMTEMALSFPRKRRAARLSTDEIVSRNRQKVFLFLVFVTYSNAQMDVAI